VPALTGRAAHIMPAAPAPMTIMSKTAGSAFMAWSRKKSRSGLYHYRRCLDTAWTVEAAARSEQRRTSLSVKPRFCILVESITPIPFPRFDPGVPMSPQKTIEVVQRIEQSGEAVRQPLAMQATFPRMYSCGSREVLRVGRALLRTA